MIKKHQILFCALLLSTIAIIVILDLSLSIYADGKCYCFDDGIYPALKPDGYFQINEIGNDSFLQFGHPRGENQIKLKLDTDATVAFKWHHSITEDSGILVFLAPNIEKPIECHSNGGNSTWEPIIIDVPRGEIKWLLTKLSNCNKIT